jgi:phosphoribosylanthranilate isomerase
MRSVKIKICGITNWTDAKRAIDGGADLLGFNFYPGSPRYITPAKAQHIVRRLPPSISAVGVFVDENEAKMLEIANIVGLTHLQLHGDESALVVARLAGSLRVIKAIRVTKPFRASQLNRFKRANAILLDGFDSHQRGGTGQTFDWEIARRVKSRARIFLAGGLTPENIGEAIRVAMPYGVDVCSGIESAPGRKDPARMRNLMRAAGKPKPPKAAR